MANIYQHLAVTGYAKLAILQYCTLVPLRTKVVARRGLDTEDVLEFVVAFQDLFVTPGVASLGETHLTPSEIVF